MSGLTPFDLQRCFSSSSPFSETSTVGRVDGPLLTQNQLGTKLQKQDDNLLDLEKKILLQEKTDVSFVTNSPRSFRYFSPHLATGVETRNLLIVLVVKRL